MGFLGVYILPCGLVEHEVDWCETLLDDVKAGEECDLLQSLE